MESGITDLSEFRKINDKVKSDYYDLISAYEKLRDEFRSVQQFHSGSDINFLYEKFDDQIHELKKVGAKVNIYYSNLSEILYAYHNQEHEIARISQLYLNKIKEELKNGRN